jgi:hypothetical protein
MFNELSKLKGDILVSTSNKGIKTSSRINNVEVVEGKKCFMLGENDFEQFSLSIEKDKVTKVEFVDDMTLNMLIWLGQDRIEIVSLV